jgi:hypothetical protein
LLRLPWLAFRRVTPKDRVTPTTRDLESEHLRKFRNIARYDASRFGQEPVNSWFSREFVFGQQIAQSG